MKNQTNWIVGISDGNSHEYKIGNVTFTVLSEFQPKISGIIFSDKMAAEYVCSTAGKEDLCSRKRKTNKQG